MTKHIPSCCISVISKIDSKIQEYGVFSGPYFPAFGLNMERSGNFGKYYSLKNTLNEIKR